MNFAESLLELRHGRGLSQEELAAQIGVSRQAVSKWETGEAMPDLNKLLALSDALGVSLDCLCGKKDNGSAEVTASTVVAKKSRFWPLLCTVLSALIILLLLQMSRLHAQIDAAEQLPVDMAETIAYAEFGSGSGNSLRYQIVPSAVCEEYTYYLALVPNTPVFGEPSPVAVDAVSGVFQGEISVPLSASSWTVLLRVETGKSTYTVPVATELRYSGNGLTSWQPVEP